MLTPTAFAPKSLAAYECGSWPHSGCRLCPSISIAFLSMNTSRSMQFVSTCVIVRHCAIIPVDFAMNVMVCDKECETFIAEWRSRWKPRCGRHGTENYAHSAIKNILFVRSFEAIAFNVSWCNVMSRLHGKGLIRTGQSHSQWCEADRISDTWQVFYHMYSVK